MFLFLPVNLWDVRWEAASGRPFSTFELLLLRAVKDRIATVADLQKTFKVHRRVVIEGLATLVDAAWLAFGPEGELVVTAAGASAAATDGAVPPALEERVRPARVRLVQERVCGQLCPREDVFYRSRKDLDDIWAEGVALPPGDVPFSVEPGMVRPFLKMPQGTYPRWIGPAEPYRAGADYLVVWADPDTDNIAHLPRAWRTVLREQILDWARHHKRQMVALGRVLPTKKRGEGHFGLELGASAAGTLEWRVSSVSGDMLLRDMASHVTVLSDRLRRARSYVIVASRDLAGGVVSALEAEFAAALQRGVYIDVLYGQRPSAQGLTAHKDALAVLKKLRYDSSQKGSGGRLLVAAQPSGSNVPLIASDPDGQHEVVVGSFDWLGDRLDGGDVSIRLVEEGVVAQLFRVIADLARADESLSSGTSPARLQNIAAELEHCLAGDAGFIGPLDAELMDEGGTTAEMQRTQATEMAASGAGGAVLRLHLGRQVDAALSEALSSARKSIALALPDVDTGSESWRRIRGATEKGAIAHLRCGRLTEQQRAEVAEVVVKFGGTVEERPGSRECWVNCDDDRVVLLAGVASPGQSARGYADCMAIEVIGSEVGSRLSLRVAAT